MKERPILFSAPMVRAILSGQKTQTRRVVKQDLKRLGDGHWYAFDHKGLNYRVNAHRTTVAAWANLLQFCPYGQPGDRLWVRETFVQGWPLVDEVPDQFDEDGNEKPIHTWYRATSPNLTWADEDGGHSDCTHWRPSIHMPRTASRITLAITGIRVERLHDISEFGALAEGITYQHGGGFGLPDGSHFSGNNPVPSYASLWESINGDGSWAANPWVWVVEFKRIESLPA